MEKSNGYAILMKALIKQGIVSEEKFREAYNNGFTFIDPEAIGIECNNEETIKKEVLAEPLEWYLEK